MLYIRYREGRFFLMKKVYFMLDYSYETIDTFRTFDEAEDKKYKLEKLAREGRILL